MENGSANRLAEHFGWSAGFSPLQRLFWSSAGKVWSLPIRKLKRRERRAPGIQMAAFSRKPLRCAKLFYLFDDEHFDRLAARHEFETELVKHGLFESFVMFVFSFEKRIPLGHMNAIYLPIHNHT